METLPTDFFVTSSAYTANLHRSRYASIDPSGPSLSQAGRVIIITGASSGIGARGLVPAFAQAGPRAMVLVGRDMTRLQATEAAARRINPHVEYVSAVTDITDAAAVATLFSFVQSRYGHADVLVNNAGVMTRPREDLVAAVVDPAAWWADFEVNVKGTFLMTNAFLSLLPPDLQPRRPTIITLTAPVAASLYPGWSSYSISKLAAWRIADYVAAECPHVTSIALQPGLVMTDMVLDSFKRFALDNPDLVGGTAVWLATEAASFLTGRCISANWSVDDLVRQKDQILASNDLKLVYHGNFGLQQFQR